MTIRDLLFGKALTTGEEGAEQLSIASGIPIFGLDALSSAAYGPEAVSYTHLDVYKRQALCRLRTLTGKSAGRPICDRLAACGRVGLRGWRTRRCGRGAGLSLINRPDNHRGYNCRGGGTYPDGRGGSDANSRPRCSRAARRAG